MKKDKTEKLKMVPDDENEGDYEGEDDESDE